MSRNSGDSLQPVEVTLSSMRYILVSFTCKIKSPKGACVKGACPLTQNFKHFQVVSGYPPDILDDILEGIVPGVSVSFRPDRQKLFHSQCAELGHQVL